MERRKRYYKQDEGTFICDNCDKLVPLSRKINMLYEPDYPFDYMSVCPTCYADLAYTEKYWEAIEKLYRPGVITPETEEDESDEEEDDDEI